MIMMLATQGIARARQLDSEVANQSEDGAQDDPMDEA